MAEDNAYEAYRPKGYLPSRCPNCLEALKIKSTSTNFIDQFPFVNDPSQKVLGSVIPNIFDSSDSRCPILKCSILDSGCNAPFISADISISSSEPYQVQAKQDDISGKTNSVCFECTNGFVKKQKTVTLTQDPPL